MTQTTLTNCQKGVLLEVIDLLQQLGDREQMRADAYLAKYKNRATCEAACTPLKWAIEREFPYVKS